MSHVTSSPPETGPGLKKTLSSLDAYAMGFGAMIGRLLEVTGGAQVLADRLEPTLALIICTFLCASVLGIVLGVIGAARPGAVGKAADVVLWNGNPFSSYALAEQVYVDGARVYDRHDRSRQATSDFLLGQDGNTGGVQ